MLLYATRSDLHIANPRDLCYIVNAVAEMVSGISVFVLPFVGMQLDHLTSWQIETV
jgi:hypothetical protein